MATMFRCAVVALARAKKEPTPANVRKALEWCRAEWGRGGSMRSLEMLREAEALAPPAAGPES